MDVIQVSLWTVYLAIALFALIRGSDMFVVGARQIGAALGMSKFAIGVLIVGFGTSLSELAAGVAAVLDHATEIVPATAIGSNITNILLTVGIMATLSGRIIIKKDLIKSELPIFFISTALFILVVYDGVIDRMESLLLLGTFAAYIWYLFVEARAVDDIELQTKKRRERLQAQSLAFVVLGTAAMLIGAEYTVRMVANLADAFTISAGLISIFAIGVGTSLPELVASVQAIKAGETEMAIGNIFGSNVFNILVVIGIPGLIHPLTVGPVVMQVGLGVFVAASAILFVNGLARQVMRWEGMMLLIFFAYFLLKLATFL